MLRCGVEFEGCDGEKWWWRELNFRTLADEFEYGSPMGIEEEDGIEERERERMVEDGEEREWTIHT